jgi:DNA-directed RNA polymerase alpha subunit
MITKDQVLKALEIIEKYQEQQKQIIQDLEVKEDPRSLLILGLKTREINSLKDAEVETIGELLALDRFTLRLFRNLGKKGIIDINKKLKDFGIDTPEFSTR